MTAKSNRKTLFSNTLVGISISPKEERLPCLVQFSGASIGRPFFLEKSETILGRELRAGIHIAEKRVSRRHARILRTTTGVILEDLESVNGVYLNSKRIKGSALLADGDMIRIGPAIFKFFASGSIEQLFHDKLYRLATIDEKTQVFNDKYFMSTLTAEIEIAISYRQPLALIIYDLDHFKKVNDTFGHLAGDRVLLKTAEVTSQVIRKNDVLCRYGGEEFAIIAKETDLQTAVKLAGRICKNIARTAIELNHKGGMTRHVQTISAGVAQLRLSNGSVRSLIKDADSHLYKAKKSGRNMVCW